MLNSFCNPKQPITNLELKSQDCTIEGSTVLLTFYSQDNKQADNKQIISNSPYCVPYSSCKVSLENLVMDQPIIPQLIIAFILSTRLLHIVLIL